MPDARELDRLVATKIMGWKIRWFQGFSDIPSEWLYEVEKSEKGLPEFSSKIESAWLVVKRMRELGYTVVIHDQLDVWTVLFFGNVPQPMSPLNPETMTLPTAICLAALAALGVELPHD